MVELLTRNSNRFLPITSPWETVGGSAEQITVNFLRGCILSSFGMVEMQLKQIAYGGSKLEEYRTIRKRAPWKRSDFLKYIRDVAAVDGPVRNSGVDITGICNEFEAQLETRDHWAHGHLVVLPGARGNRWDGSWITLESWKSHKGKTTLVTHRWSHSEIESQVETAKILADKCNIAFSELSPIVPI